MKILGILLLLTMAIHEPAFSSETGSGGGGVGKLVNMRTIPATKLDIDALTEAIENNSSVYSFDLESSVIPVVRYETAVEAITEAGNPVIFVETATNDVVDSTD